MTFDADSTTEDVLGGIDLTGKRVIVTGASSGLGEETARALASRGASVTIAVRNIEKGKAVVEKLRQSTRNPNIDARQLELSIPESVRTFAKGWLGSYRKLDLLINNAGVMACPLRRTREGWEMQFATTHLGHFLLTCLLVPALREGNAARIVNLSSSGHRLSDVNFEDPHFQKRPYDKWVAYGQSKTANILFSVEINNRLISNGITANAVHPGVIQTELGRHLTPADIQELMSRGSGSDFKFKAAPAGAATSVWAATSPDLQGRGGLYLEDCHVAELNKGGSDPSGYAEYARNPETAKRLWVLSENTLGAKFDLA
jgi:NAD(P)-dependent dehydrogenase (short-subunit alcohol dehydrogenase family)